MGILNVGKYLCQNDKLRELQTIFLDFLSSGIIVTIRFMIITKIPLRHPKS